MVISWKKVVWSAASFTGLATLLAYLIKGEFLGWWLILSYLLCIGAANAIAQLIPQRE